MLLVFPQLPWFTMQVNNHFLAVANKHFPYFLKYYNFRNGYLSSELMLESEWMQSHEKKYSKRCLTLEVLLYKHRERVLQVHVFWFTRHQEVWSLTLFLRLLSVRDSRRMFFLVFYFRESFNAKMLWVGRDHEDLLFSTLLT